MVGDIAVQDMRYEYSDTTYFCKNVPIYLDMGLK